MPLCSSMRRPRQIALRSESQRVARGRALALPARRTARLVQACSLPWHASEDIPCRRVVSWCQAQIKLFPGHTALRLLLTDVIWIAGSGMLVLGVCRCRGSRHVWSSGDWRAGTVCGFLFDRIVAQWVSWITSMSNSRDEKGCMTMGGTMEKAPQLARFTGPRSGI